VTELVHKALSLRRYTLRVQLTLLYSGLGIGLCAAVLGAAGLLIRRGSQNNPGFPGVIGSSQDGAVRHFEVGAAVIFVGAALIAMVVGWWIAGRLLRPLRTITATARDISATNLHQRLALNGPEDEITELGQTLDGLFGRLETSFESQRHFVANASHELRSPLTAQRTLLEVALADPDTSATTWRTTGEKVLKWNTQQERLIDALLTLASSEGGVEQREPVDLARVTENVVLAVTQEAERRGIDLDVTLAQARTAGDPQLVESLVANLVDNAVRHNLNGGWARISTATNAGRATISISNTGVPIPSDEVERLFQPFERSGNERIRHMDGHGLGLTIVRAIADAHDATLTARPRPGGGLEIDVIFPP
jgi:signal transduction histidine kinase